MEVMDAIRGRRSVRAYESLDVAPEHLALVLDAVKWAPSWANTQCWEIVVVRDPAVKQRLQATLPPKGNPALAAVVQAPVVLALCGRLKRSGFYKGEAVTKFGDWFMFDLLHRLPEPLPGGARAGPGHRRRRVVRPCPGGRGAERTAGLRAGGADPARPPRQVPGAPARREPAEFAHPDRF